MDQSCSDLEFFDFKNVSEEEIKEIQAILKGPGSNGCVELPWEIPIRENSAEVAPQNEGAAEKTEQVNSTKSAKTLGTVVGQALHFASPQTPLSPPIARLPPPPVEAFVTPPTTIGPYPNTPYFVSRTIPYLRAYSHVGVPFFACPIPGAGESSPMPSPYGQFVPIVPATVGQEKFVGQIENENTQKNRGPGDRQFNRRNKKKLPNAEYCGSYDSENVVDVYRDAVLGDEQTSVSSPVSSTVSNERPTSVPLVPLPVPPSTFGVAGGTLPLHGYPPGLHTLPYTQMSGPQAPSAAMYYVPVFNHPYGSYIPSPPSAPMVLPVNLRPESEPTSEINTESNEVIKNINTVVPPVSHPKSVESVQSNCEIDSASEQCVEHPDVKQAPVDPTAKNTISEVEEVIDCNSSSDYPLSKSISSSPDCIPETADDNCKCQPANEDYKEPIRDSSRCWADLFKKPCTEVNGIDRQLTVEQGHENINNLNKDISNGKLYSVP
ncbi:hypothetical protein X975_00118, partial [Stegodyphus mimosarum]